MNKYTKKIIIILTILVFSLPICSFAKNKVRTEIDTISAIQNIIFDTSHGRITVTLPEEILAGDMISGTIKKEPKGENKSDIEANMSMLDKYSVEINNTTRVASDNNIKFTIPKSSTGGVTYMILRSASGDEWARNYITYQNSSIDIKSFEAPSRWEYQSPKIGRSTNPSVIKGPFDGNFGTTSIIIGNTSVRKIAESPRVFVFENPSNPIGNIDLVLNERGVNVKRKYSNIKVVKVNDKGNEATDSGSDILAGMNKSENGKVEKLEVDKAKVGEAKTNKDNIAVAKNETVSENKHGLLKEAELPLETDGNISNKDKTQNNSTKEINTAKQSEARGKYTVQIASYKQEEDARKLAEKLQSKGYEVYITEAQVPSKGTWHRVRIGAYASKNKAKNYGSNLAKNEPLISSMFVTLKN